MTARLQQSTAVLRTGLCHITLSATGLCEKSVLFPCDADFCQNSLTVYSLTYLHFWSCSFLDGVYPN